jgi:hypothetical protein
MIFKGRNVRRLYLLVLIAFDWRGSESSITLNSWRLVPSSEWSDSLPVERGGEGGSSSTMVLHCLYIDYESTEPSYSELFSLNWRALTLSDEN